MDVKYIAGQKAPESKDISRRLEKTLRRLYKDNIDIENNPNRNEMTFNVGYSPSRTLNSILRSNTVTLTFDETSPLYRALKISTRIDSPCTDRLVEHVGRILEKQGYATQDHYNLDKEQYLPNVA